MAYTYRISANALKRIKQAILYLEEHRTGYGLKFDKELQNYIQQLTEGPEIAAPLYKNRRRGYLYKFKYHVIYSVHHDRQEIVVHTVAHHSRHSKRWKEK
jgi:plasmid stabilization system protein ParE